MIVESILLNLMYDVPSDPSIKEIVVEKECVTSGKPPVLIHR